MARLPALLRQLRDAIVEIGDDRTAKVVVLSGAGPAFCAGADFDEFTNAEPPNPADSLGRLRLVIACIRVHLDTDLLIRDVVVHERQVQV